MRPDPRLYVPQTLISQCLVSLDQDQNHYLSHVMRCKIGNHIRLFNGYDGEWQAEIKVISKNNLTAQVMTQLRPQITYPDIHLYFAPLKPDPLRFLIEKSTELNVTHFYPIQTARTNLIKYNPHKLERYIIEACEQSGRLTKPHLCELISFKSFIADRPKASHLFVADERRNCPYITASKITFPVHILIGPEGGFSVEEFKTFEDQNNIHYIKLAPSILRAETAAVTILSQVQPFLK